MPRTNGILFREEDGSIPFLDWFGAIPAKAQDKCRVRLERFHELGHELRRPEADLLRDGIYELRVALQGMNYRMLYFFHGRAVAIVAHRLTKEGEVPAVEINRAFARRRTFVQNPKAHTYEGVITNE